MRIAFRIISPFLQELALLHLFVDPLVAQLTRGGIEDMKAATRATRRKARDAWRKLVKSWTGTTEKNWLVVTGTWMLFVIFPFS